MTSASTVSGKFTANIPPRGENPKKAPSALLYHIECALALIVALAALPLMFAGLKYGSLFLGKTGSLITVLGGTNLLMGAAYLASRHGNAKLKEIKGRKKPHFLEMGPVLG